MEKVQKVDRASPGNSERTYICYIALALIAALPILPALFGAGIGTFNLVHSFAPWNQNTNLPWNVLLADSVLQFFSWRQQVFQAWQHFQIPWWNPYVLNGTPLLANSQSGALYPPHIICGILRLPTALAMGWLAWFHLFWAGLGVNNLVRLKSGSFLGALIAGGLFILSPFMLGWTPLPSVIETFCWAPWIFKFALEVVQKDKAQKPISAFKLALCIAMMLLAGHLQFAAYGLIGLFVFALVELIQKGFKSQVKMGFLIAVAMVVGVLFASPQLIPVLQLGKESSRVTSPTMENYSGYIAGADQALELAGIVAPEILGMPLKPIAGTHIVAYWPAMIYRGANFAETAFGLGTVTFLILILGASITNFKRSLSLIIVGLVGLLLAFGTPINLLIYFGIPGWPDTGSPGRAACLFVLAGTSCSGLFFDKAISLLWRQIFLKGVMPVVLLIAISLDVAISAMKSLQPQIDSFSQAMIQSVLPNVIYIFIALLGGLLMILCAKSYLSSQKKSSAFLACYSTIIFALIGSVALGENLIPTSRNVSFPFATGSSLASLNQRVATVSDRWDLLTQAPNVAPPNLLSLSGTCEVGGYDSLIRKEEKDRLQAVDGQDPAAQANGNMLFIKPGFNPALLEDLGVSEVISLNPIPGLQPINPINTSGIFRYVLLGPGRASVPNGRQPIITRQDAESITLQVQGLGPLTLRDDLGSDWTATVNNIPTRITRSPWPQVDLPAGSDTVIFKSQSAMRIRYYLILDLLVIASLAISLLRYKKPRIVT